MQFRRTPSPTEAALEDVILNVLEDLYSRDNDSEEFPTLVEQLTKLHAVRIPKDRVSKDALVAACATLLSVVAIVGHEHAHVITSKAMSLIPKLH
jgi:hypothetical protein